MSRRECARLQFAIQSAAAYTGPIGQCEPAQRLGHHALGADSHGLDFESLGQHAFEGGVIILVIEHTHSADATIQHVENHPARGNT